MSTAVSEQMRDTQQKMETEFNRKMEDMKREFNRKMEEKDGEMEG